MADKFLFTQNLKEAADKLDGAMRLAFYDAITDYVFFGKEPEDPIISALIETSKPILDRTDFRGGFRANSGAPRGNSNASKQSKNNQKQSKTIKNNQKQSKTIKNNQKQSKTIKTTKTIKSAEPIENTGEIEEKCDVSRVVDNNIYNNPEKEKEIKRIYPDGYMGKREKNKDGEPPPDNEPSLKIKPSEVIERWNAIADKFGRPRIQSLTDLRKAKIKQRVRECNGGLPEFFVICATALKTSAFLRGDTNEWIGADFDFFLQASSFQKAREGSYNDANRNKQSPPAKGSNVILRNGKPL